MRRLILLGPPGSGKGTQAERIKERYDIPDISTGDIFRENISKGTELGKKAESYMHAGELVPDKLVDDLVEDRLLKDDCKNGFMLDGFPRTEVQADSLDGMLGRQGVTLDKVIYITVPEEVLIRRIAGRRICKICGVIHNIDQFDKDQMEECLKCGGEIFQRKDDQAETTLHRINVYKEQTMPLVDYYRRRSQLVEIDGNRDPDEIFADILKIFEE